MRIALLVSALALAACATPQENPHYRFSSAYNTQSSEAQTQMAAYRTPVAPSPFTAAPTAPDTLTRVSPNCIATGNCQPVGVAEAPLVAVSQPWTSPTEEMFAGGEGTPGFQALSGEAPAPMSEPVVEQEAEAPLPLPKAPSPITEDQGTLTISGPIIAASDLTGTQSRAVMHRVESGDTVYSLSRQYCTTVDAVRSMNGVGDDFRIKVGQDLKLPARCQ